MSNDDELESLYNPSCWSKRLPKDAVVKEHIKFLNEKSEDVLNRIPNELNIEYGPGPREKYSIIGINLPLDSPIIIHIHGGYYQEELINHVNNSFIANIFYKHNIKTISLGYELSPKKSVVDILKSLTNGCRKCLQYALECKSRGIYFCGHSGGAHAISTIFSNLTYEISIEEKSLIKGAFIISALFNIEKLPEVSANQLLNLTVESAQMLSPLLTKLNYEQTQFYLISAENDSPLFLKQAKQFHRKLQKEGIKSELHILSGVDHFDIFEKLYFEDFELTKLIINVISKC
ncbi:kynurenine formamidase-like [Rhynchophorus ferrugineus]|uniref:kynurenine formamidase-like n=1 Tax=Rhynchophorus ferrugineus TaxID=354439 RepID=UPI003FCD1ED6